VVWRTLVSVWVSCGGLEGVFLRHELARFCDFCDFLRLNGLRFGFCGVVVVRGVFWARITRIFTDYTRGLEDAGFYLGVVVWSVCFLDTNWLDLARMKTSSGIWFFNLFESLGFTSCGGCRGSGPRV
jgi:hypothetical protein